MFCSGVLIIFATGCCSHDGLLALFYSKVLVVVSAIGHCLYGFLQQCTASLYAAECRLSLLSSRVLVVSWQQSAACLLGVAVKLHGS